MTPAAALTAGDRQRGLYAAIVAVTIAGLGFGHSTPLLAVVLERYGASYSFIGANTAFQSVAAVIATPFMPAIIRRVGLKPFLFAGVALMAVSYLAIYEAGPVLWLWFPLRFFFGAGAAALFVASEIWMNTVADPRRRGAAMGLYGAGIAGGFALGPLALEVSGYDGFAPFGVGVVLISAIALPLIAPRAPIIEPDNARGSFFPHIRKAPVIYAAAAVMAAAEASIMALAPVYAVTANLGANVPNRLVTAYGLGSIAIQYLVGRAADRFAPLTVLAFCTVCSVAGAFAFTPLSGSPVTLYPLVFAWGGMVVGIYTVGLTLLGRAFTGARLATANAGFIFMYSAGALIGPAVSGAMMDAIGPSGLPLTLAVGFVGLLGAIVLRRNAATP